MALSRSIFKKHDIRGVAEGEHAVITDEVARYIGQAFGTYLQRIENRQIVVVGRDNRHTSYHLLQAAIEGLVASGCEVIDLSLVPLPVLYWHAVNHKDAGGMMITGFSGDPTHSGFKFCVGGRIVHGEQLKIVRAFIEKGGMAFGDGKRSADLSAYKKYINDLENRFQAPRALKVVIDAGHGTGGIFAPTLFKKWGHEVIECMYCEPEDHFPDHAPDPQHEANLRAVGDKVRETGADIGIAFDIDADRLGVVDEQGHTIPMDRILAILARDLLKRRHGARVIGDVMSSQVVFDAIKKAGGLPFMWHSEHALIRAKMLEMNALLAGERSGHIFIADDYYGFDDAFYAAGRLLQVIASGDDSLSALNEQMPKRYMTPEYRPACPEDLKEMVIEAVRAALVDKGEIFDVDGIRVTFPHGWGVLRPSSSEARLSMRFEGDSEADANTIRKLFTDALAQFPQVTGVES